MEPRTEPAGRHRPGKLTSTVLVLGVISLLVPGIWIFVATEHFATTVAPWARLGEHFLRDAGAFQIGLGVVVLAVLFWRDAIGVVLAGFAAGTLMHAASHTIDADYVVAAGLAVLGLLGVVALVARVREPRGR